mgnify:CR=1 FL=1
MPDFKKKTNLFYERMKNGEEIMALLKKVKTMSKRGNRETSVSYPRTDQK